MECGVKAQLVDQCQPLGHALPPLHKPGPAASLPAHTEGSQPGQHPAPTCPPPQPPARSVAMSMAQRGPTGGQGLGARGRTPQLPPTPPPVQCISRASFVGLQGQRNCSLALISHPPNALKMMAEGSREDLIVLSKLSIRICFLQKRLSGRISPWPGFSMGARREKGERGVRRRKWLYSPRPWRLPAAACYDIINTSCLAFLPLRRRLAWLQAADG